MRKGKEKREKGIRRKERERKKIKGWKGGEKGRKRKTSPMV